MAERCLLHNAECDCAACRRIFHGIAQKIDKYLIFTKNIIEMMSGTIKVESEMGKGSTFTVELSLKLQDVEKNAEQLRELSGLRALVVDDDFNVCDSVSKMLKKIGMRAEWTTSGREAAYRAKIAYDEGDSYKESRFGQNHFCNLAV